MDNDILKIASLDIIKLYINTNTNINSNKPTIYLLVIDNFVSFIFFMMIFLVDDYNIRIINTLDNIKSNDIVIPIDAQSQTLLYKCDIYSILDDKKLFYKKN